MRAARPPLVTYFVSSTKSSSLDDTFWKKVSTGDLQHALLACGRGRRIQNALRAKTAAPDKGVRTNGLGTSKVDCAR